jgi:hypothetical protein
LLTAEKLCAFLFCAFLFHNVCLNDCNLFLLMTSQGHQPVKTLPHITGQLFGTFNRTTHVAFRSKHLHAERPNRHDQMVCHIAHFVSLSKR